MRRFRFALLASLLLVGLLGVVPARSAVGIAQPNILIIVTDDQRLDQLATMKNTVSLFKTQGVDFTNAYDSTPLCCPSRATIFSGRYAHNHGVQGNQIPDVNHLDLRYTLQKALHTAGYQTGIAGKFFNGWDINRNPPDFDRFAIMQGGYNNATFNVNGVVQQTSQYSTDFVSNQAKSMLDQFQSKPLKPWFMVVAPFAPHFPYQPAAVDVGTNVGSMPANPAQTEADKRDKPPWIANYPTVNLGRTPAQVWQDQARSLQQVDRLVARLFANQKNPQNTLAFFVSDNGYMLGEHGVTEDKRVPYPESVHVPLLMRWPAGLTGGRIDTRYAMNVDIAPTIIGATGVGMTNMPRMDGRNLLGPYRRTRVLLEGYTSKENPNDPGMPAWSSVLDDKFQYTEWYGPQGNLAFRELYNRQTDPNQLVNLFWLAPNAAPSVAAPMATDLARLRTCAGWTGANPCT